MNSSSSMIGQSNQNSTTNNNNNNASSSRQQQNSDALLAAVKMLRLGTKQISTCKDALDRLQKLLILPTKLHRQQQQQQQNNNNSKTNPFFAPVTASTSSLQQQQQHHNSSSNNLLLLASNSNNNNNNNNTNNILQIDKKLTAAEVRLNRRQFVLNSVGGPGILMNALQVAGNDFGVAEACLSLMVALLVPPDTSGAGTTSSLNSNAFNPLLPRTVKGRVRGALRRLVKKFIKKSGTRLVFALLVKHFDSSLSPSYVRGIVFPVCKLIHCFLLGDAKLTATARLSGGLQVLTRIVLAFITHSSSSSATNSCSSSNISLAVPVEALEIIIPGILTTISSLCNVKLSLSALSRNGLGVASLLNLIRNVVVVGAGPNNSTSTRNNFNSTITVQSIVRWSFRLIFNYLVTDSSSNTKIALENNIVDVCVAVLEHFSTNSSFMQLHCVILDVLTLLLYGTPFPILSECSNNNNNNNNRLRASIISPQRERDIIQLVARAACTPTFAPVRKNSPFMEDVSNPRDIVDLYNQLTKFLGMTELPIGMDAELVWRSDSPTAACPLSLLKKAGGDSSSDDDENENDDDAAGEGGELAKLSLEERDLVEEFEEKMKRRISLLCPEMNIASSTSATTSQNNNNNSNFSFTIPRETLLRFDSIVDSSSGIVKKVHYSSNAFAESTSPGSSGGFSINNPPSWPTANASTENVLPTEPVPDEPLPDDIFRQLARNQFLRLVDPRAAIAQIVFDNLQSRSKQLPEVYSHPPHHHQRIGNNANKMNNNSTNKNSSSSTSFSLPCLTFDSNFECGNLKRVIRIGDADYDVITSGDTNTERQGQWFYFAVKGMIAGVQYTFRFINAERAGSSFGLGNRPLMFSEKLFDECKNGWLRCGEEIAYFKNSYVKPSSSASALLLQQQLQQQLLEEGRKGKKKHTKKKEKKNHNNNNVENGNDNNESNEEGDEPATPATTTKKKASKSAQQQQKKETTIQSLVKPPTTMNTFHVSIRFPYSNDRVLLCPGLPYSYTDLIRYLNYLSISPDSIESTYYTKQQQQNAMTTANSYSSNTNNINPGCLMIQTFCDTDSGLPVPILTITQLYKEDPTAAIDLGGGNGNNNTATTASMIMKTPVSAAEMASRPVCVVSARVHPGETVSSFAVKGLIDFLLDPLNPVAKALRQSTVWKIIPMLNPDGVVHGHYRCDLHGYDLNRMFHPQPLAIRTPTVAHLNQLFTHLRISQHRKVVFYGDFHGHSKKTGCFTYGCGSAKKAVHGAIVESIFPAVLHSLLPGFDPEGCTYRVAQGKIATGRVVAYRQHGIRMSYTLEVSLMGGWRFAPTTTCEDDEIIERDAVRNPSAKSLAERKHFKNLALQKLRRNRSDQNNNNNKGEGNDDADRKNAGEEEDDDADEYDDNDNGPELVLHTPQSLCAIGAMFVKAFYCIAENFLSVRAEDLFRVKKPNIVDTQGNIVGTTYEVEALPRRGVVAETAANLLIAHAKLEKQKRIQAMERKILAKNANAKKSNTNAGGGGGTSNKKDLKNNAGATSTPLLPSNSGNFLNNNNDNLNTSNINNNALTQMQKQLSESGLQIPPHFAQEVLAACLNISSSNNKSSTNSQQQMMTAGSQDNNDVPPPSTPTASITSTSNKKATSKKSLKNTSIVMMQANNNNNNNNNSSSWSVVSSYLQDLLQVTVAWGGKPKEVGIVIGGGGGASGGGNNTNNNNIISTNIHTPLWAASISPGGLIVNSSARTVAMKESYSTRRTPTAFGERGSGGGGSGKTNSAAVGGATTASDGKGKGNHNSSTGGGNRKNRKNANRNANNNDDDDDDNGGDDEDFGEDEDDDDADAGDDDDDEDEDDDDLFDDDDDDDDDELADEDDNEDDNNEDEGDEVMNEHGDDDQNNNNNNNDDNDDEDYDDLNDENFARADRTNSKFMRSTNPAPGESSRNSNSNVNTNNNINFNNNNNNNSTTCYRGESSNTSSTTGSFSRKNSSVTPTPPATATDDAMMIPSTTPTSSQNNTSFSVKCPPPPRITPKSGNAAVVGTADTSAGTGRKLETTTTVMMKPLMKLPQHPASSSHGIVLRGNNNNNSSSGASSTSSTVQQQQPPPPRQTPCGFGLHKHLNSSRTPGANTPNNNTVVPSPPPTSNASNNNNNNNNNAQEQLQQQQQPRTTNPNIKYAGSLIRNREPNKK